MGRIDLRLVSGAIIVIRPAGHVRTNNTVFDRKIAKGKRLKDSVRHVERLRLSDGSPSSHPLPGRKWVLDTFQPASNFGIMALQNAGEAIRLHPLDTFFGVDLRTEVVREEAIAL